MANIDKFIRTLPDAMSYGRRAGFKASGGEKQKSRHRAGAPQRPGNHVFDVATSALDTGD